uniref:Protein kinase domain-containing protein n=1 Tax=Nelumbo nucifera TaxID=4432 RepID=A0A822YSE0_NELNU|nr:TPA_asm: hypothetical protein HUJ06_006050 [Nelumbo nucifera]
MHPHLFPSSYLVFFLLFICIIHLPQSLCDDDWRYSNCSQMTFNCGNFKDIGYPFWGGDRPDYCSGHPDLRLHCRDGFAEMDLPVGSAGDSLTFRVLEINEFSPVLTIARLDFLDKTCPDQLYKTTTLHFGVFFNYTDADVNLTLYYNCSSDWLNSIPPGPTFKYSCSTNGLNSEFYKLVTPNSILLDASQAAEECNANVTVPVLESEAKGIVATLSNLPTILEKGFEVSYSGYNDLCGKCEDSGGQCGYNSTLSMPMCFCPNQPYSNMRCGGVSTCGLILVVPILSFFLRRKFFSSNSIGYWKTNAESLEECLKNFGSMAPTRYKYSDIKKITNVFKDKLGQGGYGGVYKGTLIDGRLVAVKVLTESKGNGEEFTNEVVSITRTSHVNIVTLLGFCIEGPKRALVYEFMPNGSLEKFIYDDDDDDDEALVENHPRLGFERLYQIALGIARGLEYLHRGCNTRIVHFDIKPHNILLDEDFRPKISDFGLAKLCPRQESILSMTGARGTVGYIAPEVFSRNFGVVSHKSDVYSYGMMVLEMVGRRKNVSVKADHTSEIYFPHWIYKRLEIEEGLGLLGIKSDAEEEIAKKMILVGLWCIQTDPAKRPPMDKVLDMLARSIESLQIPPKPFLYSPPRSPTDSPTVRDEEDSATTSISTPIIEEMSESQEIDLLNSVKTSRSHSRSQHGFSLAI